jgi:hypothetical protein
MAIDQRKLDKELIFTGRGTLAELLSDTEKIAARENQIKFRAKSLRWLALALFLALTAAAMAGKGVPVMVAVLIPAALLGYSLLMSSRIIHDRGEFLRLILKMLDHDAGKRGRFEVLLRLRRNREKISEGRHPHDSHGKQTFFKDSWLSLSGRLGDGTVISESCIDLIRERKKRNARGKTKTKERRTCLVRVRLDYPSERYGDAIAAARVLRTPFRLPHGAQMKAFNSTDKTLSMKTMVKDDPSAAALDAAHEAVLLGAYRILNLARTRARAAGGAK